MEGVLSLKRRYFWSDRTIKVFCALIFLIALPIYLYIGFQPASSTDYSDYPVLEIPVIGLQTPVATINLENHELVAPATVAGVYQAGEHKQFIIGHSSTVFKHLEDTPENATFEYNGSTYQITQKEIALKSEIDMSAILADTATPTIIIMTCAGQPLPDQDATHRLIITAEQTNSSTLSE